MKKNRLAVAILTAALAATGCTDRETDDPSEGGSPTPNTPPIADAGADLVAAAGAEFTLSGSGSDIDGSVTNYEWSQTSGPGASLQSASDGQAVYTAPQVEEAQSLVFELRVTDDGGASSEADSVTVTVQPIRERFFGTAVESAEDYTQLTKYFDQLTPGNAGKWGSVEAERDVMDWTALDEAHTFAKDNELHYKHHTLIWGQQQPAWLDGLSPEEQLEEIEEWMTEIKARYPDLEMIDVVNEPLHAPPAYKEALGGDGETGWDWLINAFKMARVHFPDSTLLLNDYNILQLEESTKDYLALVQLLQAEGLIDGIGVQSHFLEQTSAETLRSNLDLLAATGLPIYVSELDINFIDDARQANKMRELFSVFWQHPAVAGVTHWGYREGATWRTEAWLLNSDGTERPAFTWMNCYLAGEADCSVPEYVPAGWSGDESGVKLEAELYEEGEGILASGDVVAYTDLGDWILFKGVEFQSGWDSFSVNYSKGEGTAGSIEVRLDSLDSANVASIGLPSTGGWSEFQVAETEWAPIEGAHDVYFRFSDTRDIGNIDWLRFAPAGSEVITNLVEGEFELSIGNWFHWAGGTLSASDEQAHSGSRSLKASGFSGGGYAANEITTEVVPGTIYPVSLWVWLSQEGRVTLARELAGCEGPEQWIWVDDVDPVPAQTWTQLSGELAVPEGCEPEKLQFYLENTADGTDVYIDDVEVAAATPVKIGDNLVADGGFEDSATASGWSAWYMSGTLLELSTEQAQAGSQSLKASNRTENSNPSYDLTGKVEAGKTYAVSAQVLHNGTDAVPVMLSAKLDACPKEDGTSGDTYPTVAENTAVPPGEWAELTGTLEVDAECSLTEARIYLQGTPFEVENLYIDEVSVTQQ